MRPHHGNRRLYFFNMMFLYYNIAWMRNYRRISAEACRKAYFYLRKIYRADSLINNIGL